MPPIHANARDVALARLSRANRWMIAGSVALTAVFSEVAANALPGRGSKAGTTSGARAHDDGESLKSPSEAPRASTTPEVSPSQEAPPIEQPSPDPSQSTPQESEESEEAQEAAPPHETAPPAEQSAPTEERASPEPAPAPTEASPPVVSGGS